MKFFSCEKVASFKRLLVLCLVLAITLAITAILVLFYRIFDTMTGVKSGVNEVPQIVGNENASIAIKRVTIEDGSIPETHLAALIDNEAEWGMEAFQKLRRGWVLSITTPAAFINNVKVLGERKREVAWDNYAWVWHPETSTAPPSTSSESHLEFVEVSVCDMESDNCTLCASKTPSEFIEDFVLGFYTVPPKKGRVHAIFNCSAEKQITQTLKVLFPNNKILPCEIKIRGKKIIEGEIYRVDILRASEVDADLRNLNTSVGLAIDDLDGTSQENCFRSEARPGDSWVSLEIPWSVVTHVDILTISNGRQGEGLWVDVCSFGRHCSPCGVMTRTGPGKWGGVYCLGGFIAGNEVRISHSYKVMEMCEIKIMGSVSNEQKEGSVNKLEIIGSFLEKIYPQGDPPVVSDISWSSQNTHNGIWDEHCFETFQRLVYRIGPAIVNYIRLRSLDTKQDLSGTIIRVCQGNRLNCEPCGTVEDTFRGGWVTLLCPKGGIQGYLVTVEKEVGQKIWLCEIEFYGQKL